MPKAARTLITHRRLRELLDYDPATGVFTWLVRRRGIIVGMAAGARMPVGYITIGIEYRKYYAHRLAWFYMTGQWPKEIDHINMRKDDNRWSNLREATHAQNCVNTRRQSKNKSGFKGVSWFPRDRRWAAYAGHRNLGRFDTVEEAHEAYCEAIKAMYGKFARFK